MRLKNGAFVKLWSNRVSFITDFVEIVPVLDFGVKCCPYDCFSSGNNVRPVWVCKEDLE